MPTLYSYPVVIVGSGPAGLTAAIYTSRAHLDPLVLEGPTPGGQLTGTSTVENWPGEKSILGPTLITNIKKHAKEYGTSFLKEEVVSVNFSKQPFILKTNLGKKIQTKSVIIATGAIPVKLGCPGEKKYWGKGVGTCAICDGALYENQPVIVVGGGDSAVTNALFLLHFTKNIYMIQLENKLTAKPALKKQVINNPDIKIIYNSAVTKIEGDGSRATTVIIKNQKTKEVQEIKSKGIFISIGLKPNTDVFKGHLDMDDKGYITLKNHTQTSVKGIFAAGDLADTRYRQAITAAGTGCMAALDVEQYLETEK